MHFDDSILFKAIPALLLLLVFEICYMIRTDDHRSKDFFTNLFLGLTAVPLSLITKGVVLYIFTILYEYRLFTLPSSAWYILVFCFFADDFSYYWYHRLSHKIRLLWASHSVHHSSEHFTLSAAMRVPWTGYFTGSFMFWAWIPLLGIEPAMILFYKTASVGYQFWLHTERINKMPKWFESIFNTPSHHRVHHASNTEYLDKNHGGTLIIWDKIFKTFYPEKSTPTYGLTEKLHSSNPIVIEFNEWQNLSRDLKKPGSWKQKIYYLFNSPGWSHDKACKTTKQLRTALLTDSNK